MIAPPEGSKRLLRTVGTPSQDQPGPPSALDHHLSSWGPCPLPTRQHRRGAFAVIDESGLRGRGGAWFPVAAKWKAVAEGRKRPVVVVNASEGEPASAKDATLLFHAPHLVLDGAMFAAAALEATRVVCFVPARFVAPLVSHLSDRSRAGMNAVDAEVVAAPEGYVVGQESAAVNFLNGGIPGTPTFTRLRPVYQSGVAGAPTLIQNAETLAHVALIARFGAEWFRREGTNASPGTALITLTGSVASPRVMEIGVGTTLRSVLARTGDGTDGIQGVLIGGYGGGWVPTARALDVQLSPEALRGIGTGFGPGVVFLMPGNTCPGSQVAGLARWMASQGAGQCGPCANGLPAIAAGLEAIVSGRAKKDTLNGVLHACTLVEGRGACRHPDGVARMVRTALEVFASDFDAHLRSKGCGRANRMLLPTHPIFGTRESPPRVRSRSSDRSLGSVRPARAVLR